MQTIFLGTSDWEIHFFAILVAAGALTQAYGVIAHKKIIFLSGCICVLAGAFIERDPVLFIGQFLGSLGYVFLAD